MIKKDDKLKTEYITMMIWYAKIADISLMIRKGQVILLNAINLSSGSQKTS